MTSHYRHRRFANPAINFVTSEPGEISANTANRQLAIGDAFPGTAGTPLLLLAVRYFDTRAQYAIGDFVVQGGQLYRAIATVTPGAFNGANWEAYSSDTQLKLYVDGADTGIIQAYQAADTALQNSINTKVSRNGDTMTGPLNLAASPSADAQAANKKYVDAAVTAAAGSATDKVSKTGDTMTGLLVLSGDPTIAMHAATKSYVDNKDLSAYLLKSGGTMTGVLTLAADPTGALQPATKQYVDTKVGSVTAPVDGILYGMLNGAWTAGVKLSGDTMNGALRVNSWIMSAQATNVGTYYFGFGATSYLTLSGGQYTLNGGPLRVNGNVTVTDLTATRGDGTGAIFFGGPGQYIYFYGGSFNFTSNIVVPNGITSSAIDLALGAGGGAVFLRPYGYANAANQVTCYNNGTLGLAAGSFMPPPSVNGGFQCKFGDANVLGGNYFNIGWSGGNMVGYIDNTYLGQINNTSDYRAKKNITPLPSMWQVVKDLRPIRYTHADFTPPNEREKREAEGSGPFIVGDNIERWGFTAHELQETLIESAASGRKDMPNGIQSPNPFTVIAALTRALQEAMTRIEALEQA